MVNCVEALVNCVEVLVNCVEVLANVILEPIEFVVKLARLEAEVT